MVLFVEEGLALLIFGSETGRRKERRVCGGVLGVGWVSVSQHV